jgi:hypothetical protein
VSALDDALPAAGGDLGTPVPVRRLAVMAAVVAVLAVVALFTVLPRVVTPPLPTQSGERLFPLEPKRVRVVEVTDLRGWFRFVRRDHTWTLYHEHASVEVPADRLDGFLETLANLTRLVVIDDPGIDLKDFGLAPPRAVVSVRDGTTRTFTIGDRNPPLTALYVQVLPSTNIELVGSVLLWEFDKLVALTKTLPVEQRERTDAAERR